MTRAESETIIRSTIDDTDEVRWPAAEFDLIVSTTYNALWRALLVQFPWLQTQLDTVNSTSGVVDLTDSTGDLTQLFHSLVSVTVDGRQYGQVDPKNVTLEDGAVVSAEDYSYIRFGNDLHVFPYDDAADIEVRYSYRPTPWSSLSDATAIVWPSGHELAFCYAAASRLLLKGGVEDAEQIHGMAGIEWGRMLDTLKSWAPGGQTPFLNDRPEGWGSVS